MWTVRGSVAKVLASISTARADRWTEAFDSVIRDDVSLSTGGLFHLRASATTSRRNKHAGWKLAIVPTSASSFFPLVRSFLKNREFGEPSKLVGRRSAIVSNFAAFVSLFSVTLQFSKIAVILIDRIKTRKSFCFVSFFLVASWVLEDLANRINSSDSFLVFSVSVTQQKHLRTWSVEQIRLLNDRSRLYFYVSLFWAVEKSETSVNWINTWKGNQRRSVYLQFFFLLFRCNNSCDFKKPNKLFFSCSSASQTFANLMNSETEAAVRPLSYLISIFPAERSVSSSSTSVRSQRCLSDDLAFSGNWSAAIKPTDVLRSAAAV